jgi:hypothetical protein
MSDDDLCWIPAQTYTMGSDAHYAEEAPAHPVSVDGFWISRRQVTNAQFAAFVDATGHETVAERPLDPADFRVLRWRTCSRAPWSSPAPAGRSTFATSTCGGPGRPVRHGGIRSVLAATSTTSGSTRPCTSPTRTPRHTPLGGSGAADRGRVGGGRARRSGPGGVRLGTGAGGSRRSAGQLLARRLPLAGRPGLRRNGRGRVVPGQPLRPLRHGRQRLGVDDRLVRHPPPG